MHNHFSVFGLSPSYHIDDKALRKAFLQMSRETHPDFHSLGSDEQQADALQRTSELNLAYEILTNPDKRLRHLLELNGYLLNEEKAPTQLPQDFLMDMMDLNDEMEEAENAEEAQKTAFRDKVKNMLDALDNELNALFGKPVAEVDFKEAQIFFLKKRYLLRILENSLTFAPAK